MIRVLLLLLALALPARAEEVVAGLSQNRVSITANFDGSEILIFGAVKREVAAPEGRLEVIVTVAGPNREVTVRRKAKRFGIWINTESVEVDAAPSFYAVATTAPWAEVITDTEDLRYKISIPRAIRSVGNTVQDSPSFTEALIRIRSDNGLYLALPGTVRLDQGTLFSTSIALPANLVEGGYQTRIFLTRHGRVVDEYVTNIGVHKEGLEKFVFDLAHKQPFVYGILCLLIAVTAGWSASELFRFIRS
jgi:uncharacterized protein (TIGR02186 family)